VARMHSLGYLGFESPRAAEWIPFGTIFGVTAAADAAGVVSVRWDDRPYRLRVIPGAEDRIAYLGWEASNPAVWRSIIDDFRAAGVDVEIAAPDLATERLVRQLAVFADPFGIRHELFCGPISLDRSFVGTRSTTGFKTGAQGLGHAVLAVPDLDVALPFYEGVLGLRCSDIVKLPDGGVMMFMRANTRHHSIALWQMPDRPLGLQHLMIESRDLNEVGIVYDLIQKSDYELSSTMGRHTGDEQLSFYTRTPSGFDLELGCDSVEIIETEWTMRFFDTSAGGKNEIWGHQWQHLEPQSSLHPWGAAE
jgi:extradiol dioxygenase